MTALETEPDSMTAEETSSSYRTDRVFGFPVHDGRARALGEVHSRPNPMIESPRLVLQLAFMTEGGSAVDRAVLTNMAQKAGASAPEMNARYHVMPIGGGTMRWERHTEFSTYLWEGPLAEGESMALSGHPFGTAFNPPGTAISGVRVELRRWTRTTEKLIRMFDPASLCYATTEAGMAAIATDFRQDGDGMTRILILDKGLAPARIGALTQRIIEIETYRTLAMLGLPLAQQLSASIRRMEDRLADITADMRKTLERDDKALLAEMTALAAELEADAASSLYRFGASAAYHGIVDERLRALHEAPVAGHETWAAFLEKRVAPAMRTCRSVEQRQANLSRKLSRAANLLRSWVDVQLEEQNRDLLASMNQRAKLQLRLQQTVEGLSVAAVSYYVVGLVGYVAKGLEKEMDVSATLISAAAVPLVLGVVWWMVRRLRRKHGEPGES
jgi:uncharacterized membrane-anchored protein